jgi:hypothetical protein
MITESSPLPVRCQAPKAIAFGPALVRARARRQRLTIDALLKISLEISRAISEAKLSNSLLDVSRCAERLSRRHPLAECSVEEIERALEHEGAAARISMKLARRKRSH